MNVSEPTESSELGTVTWRSLRHTLKALQDAKGLFQVHVVFITKFGLIDRKATLLVTVIVDTPALHSVDDDIVFPTDGKEVIKNGLARSDGMFAMRIQLSVAGIFYLLTGVPSTSQIFVYDLLSQRVVLRITHTAIVSCIYTFLVIIGAKIGYFYHKAK